MQYFCPLCLPKWIYGIISDIQEKKSFLVLTLGKFLEALGSGIGTGLVFSIDFHFRTTMWYGTSFGLFKGTLPGAWLWGLRGPPACCYKSLDQQLDRFHPAKTGPPSNNNNVQHHFHLYYSDLCEFLFFQKGLYNGATLYIFIRYIIK